MTVQTNREAKGSVARTECCDIFGGWDFHELGHRFGYWGLNWFKLGKRTSRPRTVLLYISYYDILCCYNFGANILYSYVCIFHNLSLKHFALTALGRVMIQMFVFLIFHQQVEEGRCYYFVIWAFGASLVGLFLLLTPYFRQIFFFFFFGLIPLLYIKGYVLFGEYSLPCMIW